MNIITSALLTAALLVTWSSIAEISFTSASLAQSLDDSRIITLPDGSEVIETIAPTRYLIELEAKPVIEDLRDLQQTKKTGFGNIAYANRPVLMRLQHQLLAQQDDLLNTLSQNNLIHKAEGTTQLLLNSLIVQASPKDINTISALPGVKAVYPDHELKLHLATSVPLIYAPQVWQMTDSNGTALTGKGIRIGVLDSGIDATHPDLGGCFGDGCKIAGGYDFYDNDADPSDNSGHGTHVAGIIAANGKIKGVAPDATLYAYRVCNYYCSAISVMQALERAADPDQNPLTKDALDIVNLSLGGPGSFQDYWATIVNNASKAGIVVVVSAGNEGSMFGALGSPASAEDVITVASTTKSGTPSDFSSEGPPDTDQFLKPDISAPGSEIYSTSIRHQQEGNWGETNSGTSMAAPHVAGAAALLKQQQRDLTPVQIKSLLVNSSRGIDKAEPLKSGSGLLNIFASANATLLLQPHSISFGTLDSSQASWEASRTFTIENKGAAAQQIKLNLPVLPAGVTLQVTPATQLSLAANSLTQITLQLSVNPGQYQADKRLTLEKLPLQIESDNKKYTLMSGFYPVQQTTLEVPSGYYVEQLQIYDSSGALKYDGSAVDGSKFALTGQDYHLIAMLTDFKDKYLLIQDNIKPANNQIVLDPTSAIHSFSLASILDEAGQQVNKNDLIGGLDAMEVRHSKLGIIFQPISRPFVNSVIYGDSKLYISDLPSNFSLALSANWRLLNTPSDQTTIYSWTQRYTELGHGEALVLDPTKMIKLQKVIEADELPSKEFFYTYISRQLDNPAVLSRGAYIGGYGTKVLNIPEQQAATVVVYGQAVTQKPLYGVGQFYLETSNANTTYRQSFQKLRFFAGGLASILDANHPNGGWQHLYQPFSHDGFYQELQRTQLLRVQAYTYDKGVSVYPDHLNLNQQVSRFGADTPVASQTEYLHRCDLKASLPAKPHDTWLLFALHCDKNVIEARFPTYIGTKNADSFMSASFKTEYANLLHYLSVGHDKRKTQLIDQGRGFIELGTNPFETSVNPVVQAAEIHLNGQWQTVEFKLNKYAEDGQSYYRAEFDLPTTPSFLSLRLQLQSTTNKTSSAEYVLHNLAAVGKDTAALFTADQDKDGLPDQTDQDDDNDGISDIDELRFKLNLYSDDSQDDKDNDGLSNLRELTLGTYPNIADSDADGTPDGWELQHRFDPLDSKDGDADPDQDDLSNANEFKHQTEPHQADTDADTLPDGWEVKYALNPRLNDAATDLDQDGLTNKEEFTHKTLPNNIDTDSDGMPDGWEVKNALNPLLTADGSLDGDKDELTNAAEYKAGTDPAKADSDADGLPDGWEVKYTLNPLSAADAGTDTDKDELINSAEFKAQTDPTKADTDNDGMPDGWEIKYGMNPLSASDAGSDIDNDGKTALQEYQGNTNPTVADKPTTGGNTGTTTPGNSGSSGGGSLDWWWLGLILFGVRRFPHRLV